MRVLSPRTAVLIPGLVLGLAAVACGGDLPTESRIDAQFAKPPASTDAPVALTVHETGGYKVASDGRPGRVLGIVTPASYADGECAVTANLNVRDVIADLGNVPNRKQGSTCADQVSQARLLALTLDAPLNAGDPTFGTTGVAVHIKWQELQDVTAQTGPTLIDGGFNQLGGHAFAGDCGALRHNQSFGADPLLVTRTKTRGAGSDRNEWTVETQAGNDLAACLDATKTTVLRYYHLPFRITVTQLTY